MSESLPAAVLWDMDGTLVDSEKLWDVSLDELATRLGGRLDQATRQSLVGASLMRSVRTLFEASGSSPEPAALADAARWLLDRTAELFRDGLPWRPGAREALRSVHASGVPCALVTSTERMLTEIALDAIGRDFFAATVCGDEVDGQNKPHPRPYLKAAELLGVAATECVAVEDSPTGVASAVAAGSTVLVVPCDAPVSPGERRVVRDSLAGVDIEFLAGLLMSPESARRPCPKVASEVD